MAGFGSTFDGLWRLFVVGLSIAVTLMGLRSFGLIGFLILPIALIVFGIAASRLHGYLTGRE